MLYASAFTLLAMRWEYKEVVRVRQSFFERRPPRLYTVFVDRIPRVLSSQAALIEYFEKLFPRQIMRVEIIGPVEALQRFFVVPPPVVLGFLQFRVVGYVYLTVHVRVAERRATTLRFFLVSIVVTRVKSSEQQKLTRTCQPQPQQQQPQACGEGNG